MDGKLVLTQSTMPLVERKLTSRDRRQPELADTAVARREIKADLGLAKAVDRLHRIADREQGAAVSVLPAGGQRREQFILAARGVLKLVDQQVLQAVVEGQGEVGRLLRPAERALGAHLDLGEVDLAALLEHQLQFGRRMQQHAEQAGQARPVVGRRVPWRGSRRSPAHSAASSGLVGRALHPVS